jgi:hypothetical protein
VRPQKAARPAADPADGPREDDLLGWPIASTLTLKAEFGQVVRAELTGDICTAAGLTAAGHAPVQSLTRLLIAAGHDPSARLEVWRGDVLALRVRSLAEASKLAVEDDRRGRPRFRRLRNRKRAPPARART